MYVQSWVYASRSHDALENQVVIGRLNIEVLNHWRTKPLMAATTASDANASGTAPPPRVRAGFRIELVQAIMYDGPKLRRQTLLGPP